VRIAAALAPLVPLAPLALVACPRSPSPKTDLTAPCPSLDAAACARARALAVVANGYVDEQHDYLLVDTVSAKLGAGVARTGSGWRPLPLACARQHGPAPAPKLDLGTVDYAFVGVVVDGTLVSADADVAPLLPLLPAGRLHEVRLLAFALVHDAALSPLEEAGSVVETPSGGCSCGEATHFVGPERYGAFVSFAFQVPGSDRHVRAGDVVRAALGDPRAKVREARRGELVIDGLDERALARAGSKGASPHERLEGAPAFHVLRAVPIAFSAEPIAELCDFPAPEVWPSPLDFGFAPYGTEVKRVVHVANRAAVPLRAVLGADTFLVPPSGTVDLTLRWTPDGDAPGCESQTRDEAIPFLRAGVAAEPVPRTARVLETIRAGPPTAEHREHLDVSGARPDYGSTVRDWSCPRDFVRTACRAENAACADGHGCTTDGYAVTAEARGENACHFACSGPGSSDPPAYCRFDAAIECKIRCSL
jgi:hypothetical protein